MQEAPILLLTALSDTETRAVRRRNSAQGDAERGVRGSVRWTAQAYAHQHTAFASQLISRRDRCRSLPASHILVASSRSIRRNDGAGGSTQLRRPGSQTASRALDRSGRSHWLHGA